MPRDLLERIKTGFNLSDEALARRERVGDYIHSFASLIVDSFYDDHLLENDNINAHINEADTPRLKRALREYLIALFQDPFDENLLERTCNVGIVHHAMQVQPLHVAYGYCVLQKIICELASVNETIQAGLVTILEMLKVSEFIMNEAYNNELDRHAVSGRENSLMETFDSLFRAYSLHRSSVEEVNLLWNSETTDRNPEELLGCAGDDDRCPMAAILDEIDKENQPAAALQLNIESARHAHDEYKDALRAFVLAISNEQCSQARSQAYETVRKSSDAFLSIIGKPLQDVAAISFLAVKSGFHFVQSMSERIFKQSKLHDDQRELTHLVETELPEMLSHTLGWCIQEMKVSRERLDSDQFELVTTVPLRSLRIHIGLTLKKLPNRLYLDELVQMMLELTKINLLNKERESTLADLAGKAERANQAKDVFLANMSHELRTPLNAILGFSQIIETRADMPEPLRPYIGKIRVAGNNLLTLVNTILDFAKLEAGKIHYVPEQAMIADVIQEVVLITEPMAREKGISYECPTLISATTVMDSQLIKQVLLNLISNAIKFTPVGGQVKLAVEYTTSQSSFEFRVADTGVGIAPEHMPTLFTPFNQIDNPLQKSAGGTGLGLTIARKIVEDLHGGTMRVESVLGEGSVFAFTLPIKKTETFIRRDRCPTEDAPHLLVVEDSEEYLCLIRESLQPHYHLTMTNSVEQARKALAEQEFYYVVLDFFLVDGISADILTFMEEEEIVTPCIVISAEDDARIISHIPHSDLVEGIFSKADITKICSLLGARSGKGVIA